MNIGIASLSEVRRPDSDKIMVGGYTCYCSGRSDGYHRKGVAVAVSINLIPMVIEVTPVNEHIMRQDLSPIGCRFCGLCICSD